MTRRKTQAAWLIGAAALSALAFTLSPGAAVCDPDSGLQGTVRDESGRPVDAEIVLSPADTPPHEDAWMGDWVGGAGPDGRFFFSFSETGRRCRLRFVGGFKATSVVVTSSPDALKTITVRVRSHTPWIDAQADNVREAALRYLFTHDLREARRWADTCYVSLKYDAPRGQHPGILWSGRGDLELDTLRLIRDTPDADPSEDFLRRLRCSPLPCRPASQMPLDGRWRGNGTGPRWLVCRLSPPRWQSDSEAEIDATYAAPGLPSGPDYLLRCTYVAGRWRVAPVQFYSI